MCLIRVRLRKKTWKNPGTVFLDYHVYEEDISISSNWEVFLEVLNGKKLTLTSKLFFHPRAALPAISHLHGYFVQCTFHTMLCYC